MDYSQPKKLTYYKTKVIQFFGRYVPIILQNDNGPCPLIAICNVLLLRNQLTLSPFWGEVSQEKLLSLLAELLVDANSNVNNKDAGYLETQQQNIVDAIDLLPRLATGINVNLKFTRIHDFEFTRECAIFDLLDIPLCHGWIVDPQDSDTASSIGCKSYNTLIDELVALDSDIWESADFAVATTVSLGIPSPSLTRHMSFDDSPIRHSVSEEKKVRRGDLEEEEEILRALRQSMAEILPPTDDSYLKQQEPVIPIEVHTGAENDDSYPQKSVDDNETLNDNGDELTTSETDSRQNACPSSQCENDTPCEQIEAVSGKHGGKDEFEKAIEESKSFKDLVQCINESCSTSTADGSEPMYEGEEYVQESGTTTYDDQAAMYEGEVVLAEQVAKLSSNADETKGKRGITPRQGDLIKKFLNNNANQLTIYGLFCLQEGLKEREICLFFRNDHFNTMFKYEGELYLLVTDQGYISQPDLVWEKLDEVNGNTVYMTGSFKDFNAENSETSSWDEQNALANTAEYIASIDEGDAILSSLLQASKALQQESEQQIQQLQHIVPQPNTSREPGLVPGPQEYIASIDGDAILSSDQRLWIALQLEFERGLVTGPQTNEALNLAKTNQSENTSILKKAEESTTHSYSQFLKLCWENNLCMEKVRGCLINFIKCTTFEGINVHIEDIVMRHKTKIGRWIKQAEDIAQIKEAQIERKFIEELYRMNTVMKKLNVESHMGLNKGKLKQAQEKLNMVSEKELKQAQIKHVECHMGLIKGKLNKEMQEMETEKKLKEKMYPTEITRNMRKKQTRERREVREQEERDIMEKTNKMKEAEDIMKKALEAKNNEKIKEAKIIKSIKNMIEAEHVVWMVSKILEKKLAELLNIEKIKESEETNTSTMVAGSTSRKKHYTTDTVRRAACKLFNASLERCDFNIGEQHALIVSRDEDGYGDYDYACGNVLWIWPKLKEMGTKLQGPKDVGMHIERNLLQSDMIEGTPLVHSFGVVTFKISGKWMAKKIHRMLIEGIETWAPEVSLERAIVDHPSLDIVKGMHMDMLRRRYISRSLTHMLQYCQVHVLNSAHEACHMDLATNVIEIEERDGEVFIYSKAEGEPKLLLKRKSDRGLSNVVKDLGALWYGVKKLNAQRLLYVTRVAKQEYIETCFTAAKSAKWLSSTPLEPPCAIYVGYRSCTTKMEELLLILDEAGALRKVTSFVLRGNAANYTARDVLECCIQHTLLKTHRMADCTFDIDEILDEEGNTFLYLLNTQARIRSITNKSRTIIRELIKTEASVFILEEGEERELGFHILDFTEVLRESCFSVLPHNLCKYLYNLSQIFNRYLVSNYVRDRRSNFFLLLCEAMAVVMEKCFHLLDFTPQSFKNELGVTRLIYGAQFEVERPISVVRDPPKIQNPRFEPFSINVVVNPNFESDIKLVKLFGYIDVADTYGLRSDGWVSTQRADVGYVHLFRRPWNDPIDIITGGCSPFGDPSCSRSVPFSSSMGLVMNLVATNKEKNDFVTICSLEHNLDFSKFLASKLEGIRDHITVGCKEGGHVRINYILLKDAVDATIEVTFRTSLENIKVSGSINAYYEDGFPGKCDTFTKTFYTAPLFQINSPRILKGGPILLQKSRMAVPKKGSLKVVARLQDGNSWKLILSDSCIFSPQTNHTITGLLKGSNCSFEVKVNWSY